MLQTPTYEDFANFNLAPEETVAPGSLSFFFLSPIFLSFYCAIPRLRRCMWTVPKNYDLLDQEIRVSGISFRVVSALIG